jgi:hypothetical protein
MYRLWMQYKSNKTSIRIQQERNSTKSQFFGQKRQKIPRIFEKIVI